MGHRVINGLCRSRRGGGTAARFLGAGGGSKHIPLCFAASRICRISAQVQPEARVMLTMLHPSRTISMICCFFSFELIAFSVCISRVSPASGSLDKRLQREARIICWRRHPVMGACTHEGIKPPPVSPRSSALSREPIKRAVLATAPRRVGSLRPCVPLNC